MSEKKDVTGAKLSLEQAAKNVLGICQNIKDEIIKAEQGSIESYLDNISKDIDERIIFFEETNGRYVSGELRLIYDEPDSFHVDVELYFITSDKKWVKKQIPGKQNKIEWFFTPDEAGKIIENKIFVFEYDSPKR